MFSPILKYNRQVHTVTKGKNASHIIATITPRMACNKAQNVFQANFRINKMNGICSGILSEYTKKELNQPKE